MSNNDSKPEETPIDQAPREEPQKPKPGFPGIHWHQEGLDLPSNIKSDGSEKE